MIDFSRIVGFDWDEGNRDKSLLRHEVSWREVEQVFADGLVMVFQDTAHSETENRFTALGKTEKGRYLHVTFTLRNGGTMIRAISARDMDRKERGCYD